MNFVHSSRDGPGKQTIKIIEYFIFINLHIDTETGRRSDTVHH